MPVPVMQVGIMRMPVLDRKMTVPMCVGLASGIAGGVDMLVVRIMGMPMLVLDGLVLMLVLVLVRFREVQIEADRHQHPRTDQAGRHPFSEHRCREDRSYERRCREVRTCSRRSQVAQA